MPAVLTDRLYGENSSVAIKAPVRTVSVGANLVLSGLQTVGGVGLAEGDRILVKDQTDPTTNGIYNASISAWKRSGDFDGAYDAVNGTLIIALFGNGQGVMFQLVTPDPMTIGSSPLTFQTFLNPNQSYPQTLSEAALAIAPTTTAIPPGNTLRYGADPTGVLDSTVATQNCVTVCGKSGDSTFAPAGTYKITADIAVPVGVSFLNASPFAIDIKGASREQTIFQFSGGAIVNGIYFNGVAGFKLCGKISDLTLDGNTVAPTALTFANCDMPRAERLTVRRCTGRGVFFNTTIMGRFDNCYLIACGSAGQAQLEVLSSTTFEWHQSYCSSGNAAAVAAVRVDKSANTNFFGGAVETPGTIQIGALADTTVGCVGGVIFGMDFEKPTDHFLEFGYGMSGSAFVQGWQVRGNTGFPSGAASVPYAVKLNACTSIRFGDNNWSQNGSPTATYWLEGVTNNGVVIEAHPELYGFAWPWVMQNGAQIASATPLIDFTQKDVVGDGTVPNQGTISGTTASNAVHATQGGIYERLLCGNGGPTTMTALTGGKRGMRLYMMDPNGNTTLTHSTVTADDGCKRLVCVHA